MRDIGQLKPTDTLAFKRSGTINFNMQPSMGNTEKCIYYLIGMVTGLTELGGSKKVEISSHMLIALLDTSKV